MEPFEIIVLGNISQLRASDPQRHSRRLPDRLPEPQPRHGPVPGVFGGGGRGRAPAALLPADTARGGHVGGVVLPAAAAAAARPRPGLTLRPAVRPHALRLAIRPLRRRQSRKQPR